MNIFDVLRAPKMSEKTLSLKEEANQFAFEVDQRANKIQIKESIEKSFKVSVLKVRTMNVRGKKKRLGRYQGLKSSWKKAIVTLKEGDTIEYFEGA
ncbi:MAG TPA: 50S ribosomal protein L23 [Candidatus Lambdaproteobacteria bacterium]|jgi:large subunit ribosomal protein L23|uniref:Large ribosomal subunit protein uL23 n=2 Tax=root TaxID=1 RepID=A0A432G3K1_9DELT|nr:50S ribosomal protein L23 [SAR324 cluster bacterium]MCK5900645.1 50S ribosomal protein L23 [bacterium]HBD27687.1 50S ribosomal protein L23 [Deltaproteobacteria bacterium]HHZ86179.1 50S ribosomal protein L23 [Candidatus Lambdaproteobacteria bacterium]MBL4737885.1 50S ribosomal protein L23 [SAR324 cluster bacterium]|tara:strand:- start:41 stop:328 length:288 start_codon:yes stop_codon:yes gene_type:complete